ncbi:DNA topoisomerase IV alpha subunit [Phellopilus nigrolimitatus]|nr:DNA topoisomerase IV alpha subunit [Phellopilus nigrolimitatus]
MSSETAYDDTMERVDITNFDATDLEYGILDLNPAREDGEDEYSTVDDEDVGNGESEADIKTAEAVLRLENLALSFLSQLTDASCRQTRKQAGDGSQARAVREKKIVLELANRSKVPTDEEGMRTRTIQFPRKMKGPGAKIPAQLLRVVNGAHEALVNQLPMTKRDLYYRDVSLFKGQGTVDALVDDLAATFSMNRNDLNIRASSKGLYCGSTLSIHLHDGTSVVGHDTEASLIPVGQDVAEFEIGDNIAWILIVEKDAVFQTLCAAGLTNHPSLIGPGLLITGKGYPDLATRQLAKSFSDNMPETTRILALVDADAYGIDIVSVYKHGSVSMRHEREGLAAERVEWIGVSAAEALNFGVDRDTLIPITIHDQRKALSMLRSNANLPIPWKRELMQMLHTRRKAEIEILSSLPSTQAFGDTDKMDDDYNHSDGTHKVKISNPLVRYVIWKINKALGS